MSSCKKSPNPLNKLDIFVLQDILRLLKPQNKVHFGLSSKKSHKTIKHILKEDKFNYLMKKKKIENAKFKSKVENLRKRIKELIALNVEVIYNSNNSFNNFNRKRNNVINEFYNVELSLSDPNHYKLEKMILSLQRK